MFSSFKSNINANYTVAPNATSTAGPWRIFDAKKKSTGKSYSVFIFERKSLESHGQTLGRSGASAFKRTTEEVVERLKKEASSLAKLRHPSVLELVEPVEDTRGGGLQFVTEAVTASLASLLQEKDDQERAGGVRGRSSRYVTEDADGTRRRRELEIDELEIQKGLLQISKALEFLHENAGLVHGNLTPEAVLVNAKSDWKLSGLSFCSPAENSTKATSFQPISLHEILNMDPRLPRTVQLDLDYTSPDFVIDNNLTHSADMFSLGLLCVALYNSPHRSPLECNSSISAYKRLFSSSSSAPSPNNNYLSSRPLPSELSHSVLPRLITRRPAQRMTAKEFQESEYFDNILVSTIRFLDTFPAKTAGEKTSFMRGLNKVLPSFPKSVMEKKVLPALLEEMKDKELVALILQNVFKIIDLLPSARRAFGDKVGPSLKEHFVTNRKDSQEKDPARDASLMVVLENLSTISSNCSGKDFKDDILPIIGIALESPTPAVVGAALKSVPAILPVLDFSTIKNELFPVVATIFSKTNSLAIKIRGLEAFVILCGGSADPAGDDGLDGLNEQKKKTSSSTALDKYTMQEKIVPLIKAIKTKEPAVMMAALNVLRVIGDIADAEFVAVEILPILWAMSLGPLLDLKQFRAFMDLVNKLSRRVEDEQTKKLQELSGSNGAAAAPTDDFMSFGGITGTQFDATTNGDSQDDFERLVKGKAGGGSSSTNPLDGGWDALSSSARASPAPRSAKSTAPAPSFSWSTPAASTSATPTPQATQFGTSRPSQPNFRTVTPDLGSIAALTPSTTQFSQPLQPTSSTQSAFAPPPAQAQSNAAGSFGWSSPPAAAPAAANPWASSAASGGSSLTSPMASMSMNQRPAMTSQSSSFSLPPPPGATPAAPNYGRPTMGSGMGVSSPPMTPSYGAGLGSGMGMAAMSGQSMNSMNAMKSPGLGGMGTSMGSMMGQQQQTAPQQPQPQQPKSGLSKYESLL